MYVYYAISIFVLITRIYKIIICKEIVQRCQLIAVPFLLQLVIFTHSLVFKITWHVSPSSLSQYRCITVTALWLMAAFNYVFMLTVLIV